jgi:hypothetical protein
MSIALLKQGKALGMAPKDLIKMKTALKGLKSDDPEKLA